METVIEKIIDGLLCTDTERIRQATTELTKAYESPETLPAICQIIVSQRDTQVRQCAAMLLNKRLQKRRNWQMVPAAQKETIKAGMLQALVAEKVKTVKNAIAQFIGSLVRHEEEKKDSWLADLLQFIYGRCSIDDPKENELGSSIFATLTDAAPDQFVSHMDAICQMFAAVLMSAEAKGDMATNTVINIITGMTYLLPFVSGHTSAEQTVVKAFPLIIKTIYAFAHKGDEQEFVIVFDIVDSIAEYTPKLMNNYVKQLLEFCLEMAGNKKIDEAIRVQVITFVGRIARIKKKLIMKQKMLEPILAVLFEVICSETDLDNTDEFFSGEGNNTPVTAATQTLDLLAINMAPEKLIPPLLQLLEPALQNPDQLRRRGAFLCIAVIAEGCSEAICNKYLEVMLNIIKSGIADNAPIVRIASFFALGQFSEYMQPEISKFAQQILPVLFDFLQQLVVELKMGQPEPKHTDRMFYALETYCQNLEENIVPHLPLLMERLFETLDASNSVHLRVMALSAISSAAVAAKESMLPYFPKIISILQNYLVKECAEEVNELRIEAIDTLASITRVGGKENFIPLANDTMSYCLMMLEEGPDDPDFRRSIYNLMGSMSNVVNESMASVYPKFMDRIIESIISTEEILPIMRDSPSNNLLLDDPTADNDIDLDDTDGEDDNDLDGYQVENDFIYEKEEAIFALKEFAQNTGAAFTPYLTTSFENVYKVIEHPQETIRKASIEAICAFVIALHKLGDAEGVKRACSIVMPKFAHIMRTDEEQSVVIHLLEYVGEVFEVVKGPSVPTQEIAELIFTGIKDLLNNKMACQFNEPNSGVGDDEDPDESESDELLMENAGNLLPQFGKALTPEIYSMYFGRLYQFYVNKLNKAKRNDVPEHRTFAYGALADSFSSLGSCVVTYFDTLCPIFIGGVNDPEHKARQNCYFGLGELVLHAEEKSFESFHVILQALSGAIAGETNPGALDNICGAVARLIVTNYNMVPLPQVLPVLLSHLPLREDTEENDMVHKAFRMLYTQARPVVVDYIEQILAITIDVLYKKQMPDDETTASAVAFVKDIREQYPAQFHNVANANPEVFNFLQSL